jgi:hypothetical protein
LAAGDGFVRTGVVGPPPPRRGYTPAPRPKPVEYSYK